MRATPREVAAARPSSTTGGSSVGGCDGRAMDPRVRAARHSFEGLSRRCGPCAHVPRNIMTKIRKHTVHGVSPATRAASCLAQPSQREGQLDDDADYQTAYQSAHTVVVNGGRGWPIVSLKVGPSHRPTVDGMEDVRFESPEPHLLRRLSDIRPQHAPNINARGLLSPRARVVHIAP